jgi:ribonuclease P/MRP protein subunit POP5
MVRVKYRYLVVNFLYPEPATKTKTQLPPLVQIHSPTPDAFHAGHLARLIREQVEDLYGDYGMGMVSTGLKGSSYTVPNPHDLFTHSSLQSITGLPRLRPR